MKTSTKVTVGLGIAAVASIATTVIVSEKIVKKVVQLSNRKKVKNFVKVKFKGNEKLLNVIDNLNDEEIASLIRTGEKIGKGCERVAHYGENVKAATGHTKDKLSEIVDSIF
ncbi:hypothetical protein ACYSNO_03710 [Enterococcus sp. LJL98]